MIDPMVLVRRLEGRAQYAVADPLVSEAAACIRELVEGDQEVIFEVWGHDELLASADDEVMARHYAAVAHRDAPVRLVRATTYRSPLPPAPGAKP